MDYLVVKSVCQFLNPSFVSIVRKCLKVEKSKKFESETKISLYDRKVEYIKASLIVQFLNAEDRISFMCTSKNMNKACSDSPIYYRVTINGKAGIPERKKLNQLRCIKITNVSELPELPFVKKLICSHNNLKSLPELTNVKELDCSYNDIKYIPSLQKAEILHCGNNQIENLPELPVIRHLSCHSNNITNIPRFPCLKYLNCAYNKIENSELEIIGKWLMKEKQDRVLMFIMASYQKPC